MLVVVEKYAKRKSHACAVAVNALACLLSQMIVSGCCSDQATKLHSRSLCTFLTLIVVPAGMCYPDGYKTVANEWIPGPVCTINAGEGSGVNMIEVNAAAADQKGFRVLSWQDCVY